MTEPREVEAKFEGTPEALQQLVALDRFGGFSLSSQVPKEQDDLYFDTAGGHLRAAGSSLRIRRKSDRAILTFKGAKQAIGTEGNTVSRLEDEVDIPLHSLRSQDDGLPLELTPEPSPLVRARDLSGGQALLPTARIQTLRTVVIAWGEQGVEIELAVDRCTATRLRDGRVTTFAEVEAELKQGSIDDLHHATAQLREAIPGLTPSTHTKLQRALD